MESKKHKTLPFLLICTLGFLCLSIFNFYFNHAIWHQNILDEYTTHSFKNHHWDLHPLYYYMLRFLRQVLYPLDIWSVKNTLTILYSFFTVFFIAVIYRTARYNNKSRIFSFLLSLSPFIFFEAPLELTRKFEDNVIYYPFFFLFLYLLSKPIASDNTATKKLIQNILSTAIILATLILINITGLIFLSIGLLSIYYVIKKNRYEALRFLLIPIISLVLVQSFFALSSIKKEYNPINLYLERALNLYEGMATVSSHIPRRSINTYPPLILKGLKDSFIFVSYEKEATKEGSFKLPTYIYFYYLFFICFIGLVFKKVSQHPRPPQESKLIAVAFVSGISFVFSHFYEPFILERWDFLIICIIFIFSTYNIHRTRIIQGFLVIQFLITIPSKIRHIEMIQSIIKGKNHFIHTSQLNLDVEYDGFIISEKMFYERFSYFFAFTKYKKFPKLYVFKDGKYFLNTDILARSLKKVEQPMFEGSSVYISPSIRDLIKITDKSFKN